MHSILKNIPFLMVFLVLLVSCKKEQKKAQDTTVQIEEKIPFFKLSLAQWSFHKAIRDDKTLSNLDFAKKAKELGFEGVEYVSQLYKLEEDNEQASLDSIVVELKKRSDEHDIQNVLIMVDGEGNLASLDKAVQDEAVENHKKWVDAAKYLGCHSIRVNAHGEGSYEDVANAAIQGLSKLSEYAQEQGINILVENHGGYTSNGKWLAEVMTKIGKPNCGTLPDFGNFCQTKSYGSINDENCKDAYDIYKGVGELMPFAKAVSAKSYDFDENGNQPKIDYVKMLQIVKDAGYSGYIGVEYEGDNLGEEAGIIATKDLLLGASKKLN